MVIFFNKELIMLGMRYNMAIYSERTVRSVNILFVNRPVAERK